MVAVHVSRRELLFVVSAIILFGIFINLDLSLKLSRNGLKDSLLGFKVSGGSLSNERQRHSGGRLRPLFGSEEIDDGAEGAGVSEAKVRWGDDPTPQTEVLRHAPGWTVFDTIYLLNGTFFVVTDHPASIPLLREITSSGAEIWNDEESVKAREPTDRDMRLVHPSEARKLWGNAASRIPGTTILINDPPQFLDHYYHFCAELLFGLWRTYASLDPSIDALGQSALPSPARMMMPHCPPGRWNDYSKMNSFVLRAVFPGMAFEYKSDFHDRSDTGRAFVLDRVVFADRAAAFRGPEFAKTWRTSAEAVTLRASRYWWQPLRRNLLDFVGIGISGRDELDMGLDHDDQQPEHGTDSGHHKRAEDDSGLHKRAEDSNKSEESTKPVITYVSRQDWGRRMLKEEDHEKLVTELEALREKHGWEVHIVAMDKLSRDEQIRLAARTTILMGVHGNGLTHLIWMNNLNPRSTVMEFFYPGGFAEDYEFTSRALGIRHFGWWGDKSFTHPDTPDVAYPEGFQGNSIPLDGKAVAQLVEQRLLGERAGN